MRECRGWVHAKRFFEYGIEIGEILYGGHGHAITGRECRAEFCEQGLESARVGDQVVEGAAQTRSS